MAAALDQLDHCTAHVLQMAVIDAGANVHVQAHQFEPMLVDHCERLGEIRMPDAVLAVLAAGIGLVAVAVAETGVDAQPDAVARRLGAQLVEHVDGACVHRDLLLDHLGQRRFIHQIGGKHDLRFAVA